MITRIPISVHVRRAMGLALALTTSATTLVASQCQICGGHGPGHYAQLDAWTLEIRTFCEQCRSATRVCAVCQLPLSEQNATAVGDGRFLCARDAQLVILDDREAMRVLYLARQELDRVLARFTRLPATNVHLAFARYGQLEQARRLMDVAPGCPSLLGTTRSTQSRNRAWRHEITLLRALPTSQMISVYAHELGHAWIHENVPKARLLGRSAAEGLCEVLAYRLMEEMGDAHQMKRIQLNAYTQGQLSLFVKTYHTYDLYPILEWTKHGVDPHLREEDLDQIRAIRLPPRTSAVPSFAPQTFHPAPPAPDSLTLTGILASNANRKIALINGVVVSLGETTQVQLGPETTSIQCLEIGSSHVILALPDTGEQVTLKLSDHATPRSTDAGFAPGNRPG